MDSLGGNEGVHGGGVDLLSKPFLCDPTLTLKQKEKWPKKIRGPHVWDIGGTRGGRQGRDTGMTPPPNEARQIIDGIPKWNEVHNQQWYEEHHLTLCPPPRLTQTPKVGLAEVLSDTIIQKFRIKTLWEIIYITFRKCFVQHTPLIVCRVGHHAWHLKSGSCFIDLN